MAELLATTGHCMHNVSVYLENLSIPLGTGHLVGRDLKGRRSVWVVVVNVGRHVQHDWPHSSKQLVVHLPVHTDIRPPSLGQFVHCNASKVRTGQPSMWQLYWVIQWSWNARCNLLGKQSREVAVSLPGRFVSRHCFMLWIKMEVGPRTVKQYKCHHCCSCKYYRGKGM